MTSVAYWSLFSETGEPILYLLYREALEEEAEEKTA